MTRTKVERGTAAYLSGLHGKYFGEIFLNASLSLGSSMAEGLLTTIPAEVRYVGYFILDPATTFPTNYKILSGTYEEDLNHIARYVESFESVSNEIWLVFRNEGISLSKLIYTTKATKLTAADEMNREARNIQLVHPSAWWHWLKTTGAGAKELQDVIWQLLMALKSCHDRNITHRDIKPVNSSKLRARLRCGATYSVEKNGEFRPVKFGMPRYLAKVLTDDHHPSRYDERYQVEAAGGYVVEWTGVFHVNGELAVMQTIGDMASKRTRTPKTVIGDH